MYIHEGFSKVEARCKAYFICSAEFPPETSPRERSALGSARPTGYSGAHMLLAACAHHASVLIDVPRAGDGPPGQCTGGDGGLNIHGYFPASTGDLLPVTDIRPAMQGAASTGAGIFELARDGMAVGHDASLSLSYEQLAAAGMQHRGLTERLCRAGQEVVRRHMPARCSDILSPIQAGQPPYNAFYSNAVRVRGDLLERRPARGPPHPSAPGDGYMGGPEYMESVDATTWHRDGGDENTFVLWFPVLSDRPVSNWPLVLVNTSTLVGRRGHPACASAPSGAPTTPQLLFWSNMTLGDYILFDGQRAFHASGAIAGVDPHLERTALSIAFTCVPAVTPESPVAGAPVPS